jgi:MFS family permease
MSTEDKPQPIQHASMREVLAIPDFRRLWIAQLVSILGDFLAVFAAFAAVTFRLHGSAQDVSLILVSFLLPFAFVGPVAGVLVDRWDPRRTMIWSDLIRAGLILLLAFVTELWQLYAIFFAASCVSSFFVPAQAVVVPAILKKEQLLSGNALMQQTVQLVRISAPVIAGALVATFGEDLCYYIDSVSFVVSAALLRSVATAPREGSHRQLRAFLSEMLSGVRFILGHASVSYVILSMIAGTFAMSSFGALLAVYARDVVNSGEVLYGLMNSALGAGTLCGALVVRSLAQRRSHTHLVTTGILGVGIFVAILAAWHTRWVALAGCFGVGLGVAWIMVPAGTLLQQETPHEMRGRVSSSSFSLIALAQGIAMAGAGSVAARIGITNLYWASAAMLAVIALSGFWILSRRV